MFYRSTPYRIRALCGCYRHSAKQADYNFGPGMLDKIQNVGKINKGFYHVLVDLPQYF